MPIKFRCEYCRQLIGIAQTKAGSMVDCPTCGRTLRVPNQDGTIEPPPKPSVNLADDGLRRALHELAQLGQVEPTDDRSTALQDIPADSNSLVPDTGPTRVPVPNAVAVGTEIPANPQSNLVALKPLPPMKVVEPPSSVKEPSVRAPLGQKDVAQHSISPEEILAAIPTRDRPTLKILGNQPASPAKARPGVAWPWVLAACGLSLIIGAAGGFGYGRYLSGSAISVATQDVTPVVTAPVKASVKGRLTYLNEQQQRQPDSGASVLLLPAKFAAEIKLSATGLRPNDNAAAREAAGKALAEQGGRLVQTDDDGNFQIEVSQDGDYVIIGLSHFRGRAAADSDGDAAMKRLEEYFERPAQLVGKLAFHVATINHKGAGTLIWDHTFGEQEAP